MKIKGFGLASLALAMTLTACQEKKIQEVTTKNIPQETISFQDSIALELAGIYGLDQGIHHVNYSFPGEGTIDSINYYRIRDFIKKYGYPTKELLGKYAGEEKVIGAFTAVLLHNPYRYYRGKEDYNLFLNEVKKGNLPPEYFATYLDRYYAQITGFKQVMYGSQMGIPCECTKEKTNLWRKEIGLEPLKDEEFKQCKGECKLK